MKTLLLCLSLAAAPMAFAQKLTPAEKAYVGGYTQGSVDAVTRIVLLDDRTFCFAFTGGALDLLAAGHWRSNPGANAGITLQEVRTEQTLFPAFIKTEKTAGDTVVFNFDAYSLSDAESAVFAVSATDEAPTTMRPVFSSSNKSWPMRYTLPPMNAANVRNFYIGYAESDKYNRPVRLNVVQYKLTGGNSVLIGFNRVQAMPLIKMSAKLVDNVLHVDRDVFGKRDVLPAEVMQDVRETCIDPVLKPNTARAAENCAGKRDADCEEEASEEDNGAMMVPVKSFHMELKAIHGAPWIDRDKYKGE